MGPIKHVVACGIGMSHANTPKAAVRTAGERCGGLWRCRVLNCCRYLLCKASAACHIFVAVEGSCVLQYVAGAGVQSPLMECL